ncbi:CMRF35-like molecule 5 [Alosa sapidissima]|uniref:CMRF35-like molecule 5 n=1 Tax=Alosa sapidissima TaxID=34773 RepID=UPI001C096E27|nr:CMRF35-like molecule 5 [Alosa sapidissima]
MKTSIKFTLLSLTVLSCVRCEEITVRGHEGGNAVVNCPYQKGYEPFPKYLRKGESKDGVDVILSRPRKKWTHKERVSLQDKKDIHIFTVTIRKLTPEDAGIYWCGVNRWGGVLHTRVNLTVDRKANKPTPAAIPTVIAEVTTVTLPNTPVSTINTTTRTLSNITESERTTHLQSDKKSPTSSGHLAVGLVVVSVVIIALLVVTFRLMKRRAEKKRADRPSRPLSSARQSRERNSVKENYPQNSNTTQPDTVYQTLNPNTTQPDTVYQTLNPNTTQPDTVYHSLNPNTTQPDTVYHSLNPNTTQPDAVYQSLKPNTTQPDIVPKG